MKRAAEQTTELRRRRVARALADGLSVQEIAAELRLSPEDAQRDVDAVNADPNNPAYLFPKRAFARRLDDLDALEREARSHMESALAADNTEAANKWFESIRRIAQERGRLLSQIGVFNRAIEEISSDDSGESADFLSPRARQVISQIALAERMGWHWRADLQVDKRTEEPIPDPEFAHRNPAGERPSTE